MHQDMQEKKILFTRNNPTQDKISDHWQLLYHVYLKEQTRAWQRWSINKSRKWRDNTNPRTLPQQKEVVSPLSHKEARYCKSEIYYLILSLPLMKWKKTRRRTKGGPGPLQIFSWLSNEYAISCKWREPGTSRNFWAEEQKYKMRCWYQLAWIVIHAKWEECKTWKEILALYSSKIRNQEIFQYWFS